MRKGNLFFSFHVSSKEDKTINNQVFHFLSMYNVERENIKR